MPAIAITLVITVLYILLVRRLLKQRPWWVKALALVPLIPCAPVGAWVIAVTFFSFSSMEVTREPITVTTAPTVVPLPKPFKHSHEDLRVCVMPGSGFRNIGNFDKMREQLQISAVTKEGVLHPLEDIASGLEQSGYWVCRSERNYNTYRGSTYTSVVLTGNGTFQVHGVKLESMDHK
jgi:hypothetical protein